MPTTRSPSTPCRSSFPCPFRSSLDQLLVNLGLEDRGVGGRGFMGAPLHSAAYSSSLPTSVTVVGYPSRGDTEAAALTPNTRNEHVDTAAALSQSTGALHVHYAVHCAINGRHQSFRGVAGLELVWGWEGVHAVRRRPSMPETRGCTAPPSIAKTCGTACSPPGTPARQVSATQMFGPVVSE